MKHTSFRSGSSRWSGAVGANGELDGVRCQYYFCHLRRQSTVPSSLSLPLSLSLHLSPLRSFLSLLSLLSSPPSPIEFRSALVYVFSILSSGSIALILVQGAIVHEVPYQIRHFLSKDTFQFHFYRLTLQIDFGMTLFAPVYAKFSGTRFQQVTLKMRKRMDTTLTIR